MNEHFESKDISRIGQNIPDNDNDDIVDRLLFDLDDPFTGSSGHDAIDVDVHISMDQTTAGGIVVGDGYADPLFGGCRTVAAVASRTFTSGSSVECGLESLVEVPDIQPELSTRPAGISAQRLWKLDLIVWTQPFLKIQSFPFSSFLPLMTRGMRKGSDNDDVMTVQF